MKIVNSILTENPCYKANRKITVKGLMIHSVGCSQPNATVFTKRWNSASCTDVCVHAFIDANSGDVYQCLPWDHRGWHCGASGNNTHIGVEMCEPDCIKYTGGSTFTINDRTKAQAMVKRTYDSAVELFAYLCKQYNLDPLADGVIISHKEGYARGVASNHGDPEHLWNQIGLGYTMDGFRKAVKAAMTEPQPSTPTVVLKSDHAVYTNAANAINHTNPAATYKAGTYYVFRYYSYKSKNDTVNITRKQGSAGGWIATSDLDDEFYITKEGDTVESVIALKPVDDINKLKVASGQKIQIK